MKYMTRKELQQMKRLLLDGDGGRVKFTDIYDELLLLINQKLSQTDMKDAKSYKEIENALLEERRVQVCTINQHGQATDWQDTEHLNRSFDPGRYRIGP